MQTRFNEFTHLIRETFQVALGIVAVTSCDTSAGETALEKLDDLAPAIIADNGHVAVGINSNGVILISLRNNEWRPVVASAARFHSVCYGAGKFVAVGHAGAVSISSNGIEWTHVPSPTRRSLHAIAYGNKKFVAVGNEGAILRSSDGIRWKSADVTETRLRGIAFGNGAFVAVGYEGLVLSSRDGWNWTGCQLRPRHRLVRVEYRDRAFIAYSEQGAHSSSRDGADWELATAR
ncbi:MAG TPA: hypothetical protein VI282_02495 [Verrucomicrobiae bacterium]|jgi:photosystem II stability/assembly factor-like uncharacterized protein